MWVVFTETKTFEIYERVWVDVDSATENANKMDVIRHRFTDWLDTNELMPHKKEHTATWQSDGGLAGGICYPATHANTEEN